MTTKDKIYLFVEPHHTGGMCTVEITEPQILEYMLKRKALDDRFKDVSDEDLIDYFKVNHWCYEKPED